MIRNLTQGQELELEDLAEDSAVDLHIRGYSNGGFRAVYCGESDFYGKRVKSFIMQGYDGDFPAERVLEYFFKKEGVFSCGHIVITSAKYLEGCLVHGLEAEHGRMVSMLKNAGLWSKPFLKARKK